MFFVCLHVLYMYDYVCMYIILYACIHNIFIIFAHSVHISGELLDHGVDSFCVFLIPLTFYSVVGRGASPPDSAEGFLLVIALFGGFYIAHCEKYITGTLYLPWVFDASQIVRALSSSLGAFLLFPPSLSLSLLSFSLPSFFLLPFFLSSLPPSLLSLISSSLPPFLPPSLPSSLPLRSRWLGPCYPYRKHSIMHYNYIIHQLSQHNMNIGQLYYKEES